MITNIQLAAEKWMFYTNKIDAPKSKYSNDFAYLVCPFLSDEKRSYSYSEIMEFLQIPNEEKSEFKTFINGLLDGSIAKDITSNYKLKRPLDDYMN